MGVFSSSESESEETCSEDDDCGCCAQDYCPDLTYYDENVAKQAAAFMASTKKDAAVDEFGLDDAEADEYEHDMTMKIAEDLADKMIKDHDFIDLVPQ